MGLDSFSRIEIKQLPDLENEAPFLFSNFFKVQLLKNVFNIENGTLSRGLDPDLNWGPEPDPN